jgi:hypothetical protein
VIEPTCDYHIFVVVSAVPTFLIAALVWLIDEVTDDENPPDTPAVPETPPAPAQMWKMVMYILLMVVRQTTGVNVILILTFKQALSHALRLVGTELHFAGCLAAHFNSDEVLTPMGRQDHQHVAETHHGGFDREAARKKRSSVAGRKSLERFAALADDEPQREKRA